MFRSVKVDKTDTPREKVGGDIFATAIHVASLITDEGRLGRDEGNDVGTARSDWG